VGGAPMKTTRPPSIRFAHNFNGFVEVTAPRLHRLNPRQAHDFSSSRTTPKHTMKTLPLLLLTLLATALPAPAQNKPKPDFASLKDVIALIPRDVIKDLKQPSQIEAARRTANEILQRDAVGKTVTMEVELGEWAPWAGQDTDTDKIRFEIRNIPVDVSGLDFTVRCWVMMPPTEQAFLDKSRPGTKVKATGKLTRFVFSADSGGLFLNGDLRNSTLSR